MTGKKLVQIRDALVEAFSPQEFDEFLLGEMNYRREQFVKTDASGPMFLEILNAFSRLGRLAELIEGSHAARNQNPAIVEMYRRYRLALMAEFRVNGDNPQVRADYVRSGMSPEGFPADADLGQLERVINRRLGFINMADWLQRAARIEGQVCLIVIDGRGVGTGALVGPDLVLTNHHVLADIISNPTHRDTVQCRFDFKVVDGATALQGTDVGLADNWLVDDSPGTENEKNGNPEQPLPKPDQLDYALVRLARAIGMDRLLPDRNDGPVRGWIELSAREQFFEPHTSLYIVQHPQSRPLKLAIDTDAVITANENNTRVRYSTNTDLGSSGAPVLNERWELVAMHHYGDAQFNQGVPARAIWQLLHDRKKTHVLTAPPNLASRIDSKIVNEFIPKVQSCFDATQKLAEDSVEVRTIVIEFRVYFETTRDRLVALGKYKALHGKLHELQMQLLATLADAADGFRSDGTSEHPLETYAFQLTELARVCRTNAAGLDSFPEEDQWIEGVERAAAKVNEAEQNHNPARLREAVKDLKAVVADAPRINSLLANTAAGLHLEKLIEAMNKIASHIDPGGASSAASALEVRSGLGGLLGLKQQLTVLVKEHYAWQWLEKEFIAADIQSGLTPEERFPRWTDFRTRLLHLCALSPKQEWSTRIFQLIPQIIDAGAKGNGELFKKKYHTCRTIGRDHFFLVDLDLLQLCGQLKEIGEALSRLLRLVTHV